MRFHSCQSRFAIHLGDLHPGNVYVSQDGTKFILFDVGIVNEYSYHDHTILIDVLSAFIRKDGRKAGRSMIDDSNTKAMLAASSTSSSSSSSKLHDQMAINEEQYIDKIELLTTKASTEGYFMEHLGTYITYICDAASTHHVMMNPSFVTAALAVKIQEGIALAMNPNCSIPEVAIPIILESERRRYMNDANTSITKQVHSVWEYLKGTLFKNNSDP
jgi:predicted unusual protein kinase regulating ubiquinone biosynthesis (AarF/ABC1/UbiB family)